MRTAPVVLLIVPCLAALCARGQTISTVAGTGAAGFSGDGGPATSAQIDTAYGVAVDAQGIIYIADTWNHRVRKIVGGSLTTVAGKGTEGFSGDGGPAAAAELSSPRGVAADAQGNLYIADTGNSRIRKVTPGGVISTLAGGAAGFAGDGGPAANAQLNLPYALALDSSGNLYVADTWNFRVRKIDLSGAISTFAGNGSNGPFGDGGPAAQASLGAIAALAFDPQGNLYVSDPYNHRVRKISTAGTISTIAGGSFGGAVDGGAALGASLKFPGGLVSDPQGNLYLADSLNHRVRKFVPGGAMGTVAGSGTPGFFGDRGLAVSGHLNHPSGLAADAQGKLFIADLRNYRIRKFDPAGIPSLPTISFVGDAAGGQAVVAPGAYVSIYGSNLATKSQDWNGAIAAGRLPTELGGVSVSMGGKPAYVYYISPAQINVLAPAVDAGALQVTVTESGATSAPFSTTAQRFRPSLFLWGQYAVATHLDFSLCAKAGQFPGVNSTPAKPGEWIILWGTGFGPTDLSPGVLTPADRTHSTAAVTVAVNGVDAPVYGGTAVLAPGYAGLYQIAIQIPAATPDGDAGVRATAGGVSSPDHVLLPVKR